MSSRAAAARPPQPSRGSSTPLSAPSQIPSNVTLFLTNLRLLDLHLRPDWPSITEQTFSTKSALQNQRTRISSIEWALFRLFEIWDPVETKAKLRPFFPPLEPLQSLNLRAALFRALNELKKDGVLGRDTILRKTMLDECKGEKLEEVLMIFSAAVLRKAVLNEQISPAASSIARKFSTASTMSVENQKLLLPLAISHKTSLVASLRKKQNVAAKYVEFATTLRAKQDQIKQEKTVAEKALAANSSQEMNDAEIEALRSVLRENWLGDSQWLQVLVQGEETRNRDPLLTLPFHEVSSNLKSGTINDLKSGVNRGLLDDLNARVTEQRMRLHRWQIFREDFLKRDTNSQVKKTNEGKKEKLLALRFSQHAELVPGRISPRKSHGNSRQFSQEAETISQAAFDFQTLTDKMLLELDNVGKAKKRERPTLNTSIEYPLSDSTPVVPEMEAGEKRLPRKTPEEDEGNGALNSPRFSGILSSANEPIRSEVDTFSTEEPTVTFDEVRSPAKEIYIGGDTGALDDDEPVVKYNRTEDEEETGLGSVPVLRYGQREDAEEAFPELSEEDMLAEKIVSSIANAEQSPIKPQRNLVERTRYSLRFSNNDSFEEGEEDGPPEISIQEAQQDNPQSSGESREQLSLADRTGDSMSRNSHSIEELDQWTERPMQRLYPDNSFETPSKGGAGHGSRASTPREELFSEEADYASVFKSRPKIAVSPTFSPVRDGFLPGLESDAELEDDGGLEEAWASSPLVRTARRV